MTLYFMFNSLTSLLQQQEASEARKRLKLFQKEIISTNEKKHKVKLNISSLKNRMLKVSTYL